MNKILLVSSLLLLLISCSKDNTDSETDLIGEWKLIEVNSDPGDGSGTFQSVESDKVVVFFKNGTVASNGTICHISIESNDPTSGTYSLTDSTISSPDCVQTEFEISFELINSKLILRYPCIEGCQEKFAKIN